MGYGDNLMASGMARGAGLRGKRIAFGDGKKILWDQHSQHVFQNNPNIASPGEEGRSGLEWVAHYKGHRLYNSQGPGRWIWNYDFKATKGELFFSENEKMNGKRNGRGFIIIEPHVPRWKTASINKDWGVHRYQKVATELKQRGIRLVQFVYGKEPVLTGVAQVKTTSFRDAASILTQARVYIGPEGGLHHVAAAVDIGAVVIFGGFVPPQVTGYENHVNLTGGADACGSLTKCEHCRAALAKISETEVIEAAAKWFK